jgi:hypothetical protein
MKALRTAGRAIGFFLSALEAYRRESGRSLALWAVLALLNLATQVAFRLNLLPGEFATLNCLLAVIALMLLPVLALEHAFDFFRPREAAPERLAVFREARMPWMQSFTTMWALLALPLFFLLLETLRLPRFSLIAITLANGLLLLGGGFSAAYYREQNRLRFWGGLLVAAGLLRVALAIGLTASEPWSEMGLVAGIAAAFILLTPLLRQARIRFHWRKARLAWGDREFMLHLTATLSVLLAVFLFTNADRIVAGVCFARDNNLGYVQGSQFDAYQTAGLLGRALLWGTQPLLLILLARRAPLERTPAGVRQLFWFYVGVFVAGAALLHALAPWLGRLCGRDEAAATTLFISGFALAMLPMGLLQGLGIFALASRRYPECFVLGGSALAYALVLGAVGRPQLMVSYVFGGGSVALFLVLFVGVVRWGRRQP